MTTEQAQQRLEEIRRLLEKRNRRAKEVQAIDAQISELAGAQNERRPTNRKPLSRSKFKELCGVRA